ncbi:MAG: hypothetical protein KJO82_15495 [Gammaproteobacteria bacterium]|nr:hypothetical protein [Gammaproteobacteria bacterium]
MGQINWLEWRDFFSRRKGRPVPGLHAKRDALRLPPSVARSLAIFQLGESGGGTVVEQARKSRLPGVDAHYAEAMDLFVREENRHANVLALCVRLLGGELIRKNWTARLFVFTRRLMGLRLKVIVLLAAEVVGICYYHLLATRIPPGSVQDWLNELVADEKSHLYFHCRFLQSQTPGRWRQWVFVAVWRSVMFAAAIAVMIDHRAAMHDMGLSRLTVWRRWMRYSRLAERLVVQPPAICTLRQLELPLA